MLNRMHEGQLGINKTKNLVRGVIFWPQMNAEIESHLEKCITCLKYRKNNAPQPLMPHEIPSLPWQKVAADIFQFESKNYLLSTIILNTLKYVQYLLTIVRMS